MASSAIEGLKRVIAQKERELEALKESLAVLLREGGRVESPGITISKGGKRRTFSLEFKKRVLAELEAGARMQDILDKYKLYGSHISSWRKQLDESLPPLGKSGEKPM